MKNLYTRNKLKSKIEIDFEYWLGAGIAIDKNKSHWGIQIALPFIVLTFKRYYKISVDV
jgi:hypothetical protein